MEKLKGFFRGLVEGGIGGVFAAFLTALSISIYSLLTYGMYHIGENIFGFLKALVRLIFG